MSCLDQMAVELILRLPLPTSLALLNGIFWALVDMPQVGPGCAGPDCITAVPVDLLDLLGGGWHVTPASSFLEAISKKVQSQVLQTLTSSWKRRPQNTLLNYSGII